MCGIELFKIKLSNRNTELLKLQKKRKEETFTNFSFQTQIFFFCSSYEIFTIIIKLNLTLYPNNFFGCHLFLGSK